MYNLYTKFFKILEICKQFSENLVNESGNVPRRGPVPKFSDLENGGAIPDGRDREHYFSQAPDFGFCASQNTYYFGYKLHALCGLNGVIHSYDLSKASVADLHYMKDVEHTYHDCSIYGGKGYIGADVQLDL